MNPLFKYILLIAAFCTAGIIQAQQFRLSPQAEISIITCAPGQEALYAAFGHSAIRVNDPLNSIDLAYNYGVFDFDQPNFYLNFAKGYLNYKLGVRRFDRFIYSYQYYNRSVYEQVLDLKPDEKQKLFDFLVNNAKPENQYYLYDYFYDNCATRVWDAVEQEVDVILFDSTYVETGYTFRDLVDIYTEEQPWGDFGIDIGLGLPMDKELTPREFMFLPDYIFNSFEKATANRNGKITPIVKEVNTVFAADPDLENSAPGFFTPNIVFWGLFVIILIITVYSAINKRKMTWLDVTLFFVFGFLGISLSALWFLTDHNAASNNLNILWANPLNFIAAIMLLLPRKPEVLRSYFRYNFYFLVLVLIFWYFIPQGYNPAFYPIVLILAMRSWFVADRLTTIS